MESDWNLCTYESSPDSLCMILRMKDMRDSHVTCERVPCDQHHRSFCVTSNLPQPTQHGAPNDTVQVNLTSGLPLPSKYSFDSIALSLLF